jgi:hypothetical protein
MFLRNVRRLTFNRLCRVTSEEEIRSEIEHGAEDMSLAVLVAADALRDEISVLENNFRMSGRKLRTAAQVERDPFIQIGNSVASRFPGKLVVWDGSASSRTVAMPCDT